MKKKIKPLKPLVLCILDGVGLSRGLWGNAVRRAKTPFLDTLLKKYPSCKLRASGAAVGLPPKTMGNSEVGHIALGAGRVVNQFLRRFQLESLEKNRPLAEFIKSVPAGGAVHVVGLCSDGRVHADLDDALKVVEIIRKNDKKIIWHFIADGRDIEVKTALRYIRKIRRALGRDFVFGSLSGRWYAMDRDNNLDRTRPAFDVIAGRRVAATCDRIEDAVRKSYKNGVTDEFIKPVRFAENKNGVEKNDGVLFFNYRADRARQFLRMLLESGTRRILCFSEYGGGLDEHCPALLPNIPVKNTLGDVLAKNGIAQLRLAETEKYNHVTYFFDAERTTDYKNAMKILVPSPKVASFELKPEMSAPEITKRFLRRAPAHGVVVMNYANGDMLGHTGDMRAAVAAVEAVDRALSEIVPAALKMGGAVLITADHGNAEKMMDWRGRIWKGHTTNPVPFVLVSNRRYKLKGTRGAGLANVAPTMLKLLGIKPPKEMAKPLV